MFYPIYTPERKEVLPIKSDGTEGRWRVSKSTMQKLIENKLVEFVEKDNQIQAYRLYQAGNITETAIDSLLLNQGSASTGTIELKQIFSEKVFDTTKPTELVKHLISIITDNDQQALVLDSFSGTGTTAHSTLLINNLDYGNRKFILIELEEDIAKNVTAERLKQVINGYEINKQNGTVEKVEGLGGGFRYCKLGEPLFDKFGNVREGVTFKQLAYHIFFSETGLPLKESAKLDAPLIGKYKGAAYFLLFNGILGDKSVKGGNVLTSNVLESLPKFKGDKIIFGMANRLSSSRLKKKNIVFKQIPVEIKTS
jgi:site-specific DNA-methyltransferase (adenine-specific)/adenine-specific DNA-methyltransferase